MSDDWIKIFSAWAGAVIVAGGVYLLGGYDSFMVAIGRVAPKIEAVAATQPASGRVAMPAAEPAIETGGPISANARVPNPPLKPAEENSDLVAKPANPARAERRRQTETPGLPFASAFRMIPLFGGLR